ncbi:hypothetical protein ACFY12_12600 [Streptomyces sp. NPDC001339]|uniref:hypothetical protein n=1 Tax=Streptomyces sp. NPDC001339 TaxID=3364563 RepID=UPI0036C2CBEA
MPYDQSSPNGQSTPKGWRLDPIPTRKTYMDEDGNVRVPMWITRNGKHVADTEMALLPSEAELLSERLTEAIGVSRSIMHEMFHKHAGPGVTVASKLPSSA